MGGAAYRVYSKTSAYKGTYYLTNMLLMFILMWDLEVNSVLSLCR